MSALLSWIRRLLLALVGLTLPFEHFNLGSFGGIWITPNKLLTALLLAFAALQWAVEGGRAPRDDKRLWVVFLGLALGVSAAQSVAFGIPIAGVTSLLLTYYALILFYLILVYIVRNQRDLDLLLATFLIGCFAAAVSGWLGYGDEIYGARWGGERLGGEGGNPNLLAFNLLIAISVAISFYFTVRSPFWKLLNVGLIGVMLVAITATASRSGLLAMVTLGLFWTFRFRRRMVRYAIPVAALAAATALLAPQSSIERYSTLRSVETEYSAQGRIEMFSGTAAAFVYNPITGVGLGRWNKWANDRSDEGIRATGIHNAFMRVLAESGLLAAIPFTGFVVLSWLSYSRARGLASRFGRGDPDLQRLGLRASMLQIGMLTILVMSMFQPSNQHKGLWLICAIATILVGLTRERVLQLQSAVEPTDPAPAASYTGVPLLPRPADAGGS